LILLSWGRLQGQTPSPRPGTPAVFMPDSLNRDSLHYEFTRLKEFAYRRGWSRQLYRAIFPRLPGGNIEVIEAENSEARYKPREGRVIREVRVMVLPPFGTSVRDTSYARDSTRWFEAVANSVHGRTAERLVRRHLTVGPGDRVVPFELVQNELLLKELSSVDDALIRVVEVPGDSTAVDLHVTCRDEFSWTGSGSTNFMYNAEIGIENRNLWGIGHLAGYEATYRGRKEHKWGHQASYAIQNLFSTRVDFRGNYQHTQENNLFTLELEREFLTSRTRWAGGAAFKRVYASAMLVDKDIARPVELFNYRLVDAWGGYSGQWPRRYTFNQNFFITARYTGIRFIDRPLVSPDSNHFYYNRDTYVGALSYIKLKYFKANLIHDFGRTEEIPSGLYGTLIAGYEKHDFDDFLYLGTGWVYSWYNVHADRFYSLSAALGTFFNSYTLESGVFKLDGNYISPLYRLGRNRFRLYARLDYTRGIHRNPGDSIHFREKDIHGFGTTTTRATLSGNHRLSASFSTTLFLSRVKWGFRTSLSAYSDVGMLAPGDAALLKSPLYWGLGASLNLRNDNIVFKNLSIRLAYYPRITGDLRHLHLSAYSNRASGFHDFKVKRPEPIRYE
jgi:hypothetical protein